MYKITKGFLGWSLVCVLIGGILACLSLAFPRTSISKSDQYVMDKFVEKLPIVVDSTILRQDITTHITNGNIAFHEDGIIHLQVEGLVETKYGNVSFLMDSSGTPVINNGNIYYLAETFEVLHTELSKKATENLETVGQVSSNAIMKYGKDLLAKTKIKISSSTVVEKIKSMTKQAAEGAVVKVAQHTPVISTEGYKNFMVRFGDAQVIVEADKITLQYAVVTVLYKMFLAVAALLGVAALACSYGLEAAIVGAEVISCID